MCNLCKNSDARTYSHSKSSYHKKKLIQLFKLKKVEAEKKYGGYYRYCDKVATKSIELI